VYGILLFLHVISAVALVAGLGFFWTLYIGAGSAARPTLARLTPFVFALWGAGSVLVLVFGIWLALHVRGYHLWDGWIIAAIILWLVLGAFGGQLSTGYRRMAGADTDRPALSMHVLTSLAVLLLLIDMIWKPGA
jgi:uncharacterized membrane protein